MSSTTGARAVITASAGEMYSRTGTNAVIIAVIGAKCSTTGIVAEITAGLEARPELVRLCIAPTCTTWGARATPSRLRQAHNSTSARP